MYSMMTIVNNTVLILYLKVAKIVNLKCYQHTHTHTHTNDTYLS